MVVKKMGLEMDMGMEIRIKRKKKKLNNRSSKINLKWLNSIFIH